MNRITKALQILPLLMAIGLLNQVVRTASAQAKTNQAATPPALLSSFAGGLAAAVADAGTANKIIVVDGDTTITSAITIPANRRLDFANNAKIIRGAGGSLTFSGIGFLPPRDPYQILFQGFAPGQITWTTQMPSEISPCWFGAVASAQGGNISFAGLNDTLPAVRTIEGAFTHATLGGMLQGTNIKFPSGDFYFSSTWEVNKNYGISGVKGNTLWGHATRLLFPKRMHGLVLKNDRKADGSGVSRTIGNVVSDLGVKAEPGFYTDSTVNIDGLEMTYAGGSPIAGTHVAESNFAFPLNNGDTVSLDDGIMEVTVLRKRRAVTGSSAGNTDVITAEPGAFNASDVGANVSFYGLFIEANIVSVAANGASVVLSKKVANAFTTQGAYITSATKLDINKVEFVLYANAANVEGDKQWLGGLNSRINVGPAIVGQKVKLFYGGKSALDYMGTITAFRGNSIQVTPPLPASFLPFASRLVLAQVQGLNTLRNQKVRLNKWSGINLQDFNYGIVENVTVHHFAGDGITLSSDPTQQAPTGNANMTTIRNCLLELNASNGYHATGKEANAVVLDNLNCQNNGGHGIYDDSYLGIRVREGHIADNTSGTVFTAHSDADRFRSRETSYSTITQLYVEGGSVGLNLGRQTMLIGGANDAGFHPDSQHPLAITSGTQSGNAVLSGTGLMVASSSGKMSAGIRGRSKNDFDNFFLTVGGHTPNSFLTLSDWGIASGDAGSYGYIGVPGAPGDFILGWDFIEKAALARKLRIGDGNANTTAFTEMTSATAAPTTGSFPQGAIVWNRAYTTGQPVGWINKVAGGASFDALPTGIGAK